MNNLKLEGIMPPLTTPFDDKGELNLRALAENVARYNDTGLSGYVALGSNGEAAHLTTDERASVIETIKRSAAAGLTVIAGVNELSLRAAIQASRQAADCGADATLAITPYYYKPAMTQDALARFFTELADHSPLPVLIYNVPQYSGVSIDAATVAAISSHQNIVGIKESSGNLGAACEVIRRASPDFRVMVGNAGILYPAVLMGAVGAILAVACVAPRACADLYAKSVAGDHEGARELQNRIAPLAHIVTAGSGVAGLKAAMEMAGLTGGAPRSPLIAAGAADREKIKGVMRDSGLFPEME